MNLDVECTLLRLGEDLTRRGDAMHVGFPFAVVDRKNEGLGKLMEEEHLTGKVHKKRGLGFTKFGFITNSNVIGLR